MNSIELINVAYQIEGYNFPSETKQGGLTRRGLEIEFEKAKAEYAQVLEKSIKNARAMTFEQFMTNRYKVY